MLKFNKMLYCSTACTERPTSEDYEGLLVIVCAPIISCSVHNMSRTFEQISDIYINCRYILLFITKNQKTNLRKLYNITFENQIATERK